MGERVMLLIDADNVSVDVMDQAVRLVLKQHGALHVRRAYCTAESAVKHQAVFKRLAIKPMVNLAAGKNSTDIALAVDAVDLVLAERPDVVVIASSDSDFAPLVQRLREKGCVVRGIGQSGKTGSETQEVYDDFTVLEHHKASGKRREDSDAEPPPARKVAKRAVRKVAASKGASAAVAVLAPAPPPLPVLVPAPAARAEDPPAAAVELPQKASPPARKRAAAKKSVPAVGSNVSAKEDAARTVNAVLACLPELAAGQSLALNVAVQRLRETQLLGRNSSSLKLFSSLADVFELLPPNNPSQVRMRH